MSSTHPSTPLPPGDQFREHMAALLATRHNDVRTEIQLSGKRADICFNVPVGTRQPIRVAAECKKWGRSLNRDDVKDIIAEYEGAHRANEFQELWIITDRTPASGARDYAAPFKHVQFMTALECENSLVDFKPLLISLTSEFRKDSVSKYYIPPSYYGQDDLTRIDLHPHVEAWLAAEQPQPIAIWAGYGMGKTTYARFLAAQLAQRCIEDYGNRIPILLNLGDFTTALDLETLITTQLMNHYGIKNISTMSFRLLNAERRFILILDGFDEMKFAMAPHEFNHISAQMRKTAAANPRILLLGRPNSIQSEEEQLRLTSSKLQIDDIPLRGDDGPDFNSLRLAFFTRDQYLTLIREFLNYTPDETGKRRPTDAIINDIAKLALGNILERPVQAKMLAEVVAEPDVPIASISRFNLYNLFITRILRREEEKNARKHLGSPQRRHFMRLLAWWLWTEKKTRTFAANEVPLEIIKKFLVPGVSIEGLRRELLIGSVLEEKHIGYFLAEKDAGIFYFPHTSFTEFLVADYITSSDFVGTDIAKLPDALYGEVPTFLREHPTGNAVPTIYKNIKMAQLAMSAKCISELLADFDTRISVETTPYESADAWDVCLRYFIFGNEDLVEVAKGFLAGRLESGIPPVELAAMYCLIYDNASSEQGRWSITFLVNHLIRRIGIYDLLSAQQRGETTARSHELNHIASIVSTAITITHDQNIIFSFPEFTAVALSFIGMSCMVPDYFEKIPKTFTVLRNDLLSIAPEPERRLTAELLGKPGQLKVLATTN
jgi:hypothetical protein